MSGQRMTAPACDNPLCSFFPPIPLADARTLRSHMVKTKGEHLFTPLARSDRQRELEAYRDYLAARDGVVDVEARTLSKREASMARFRISGNREIDRALFDRQYARFDPLCPTPREMLLLLALVKVNAAEAWGVNRTFDLALAHARRTADDTEVVLLVEETYHTRILLSTACLYGIDVRAPFEPNAGLRALVSGIATLPQALARPLTLAAEIVGVLAFQNLLEVAGDVLRDSPEVRDAVEERLIEVLIDELGHVSFQRLGLGHLGLLQAKALVPIVARGLSNTIPEARALGATPKAPLRSIEALDARLPEAVRRQAFFA